CSVAGWPHGCGRRPCTCRRQGCPDGPSAARSLPAVSPPLAPAARLGRTDPITSTGGKSMGRIQIEDLPPDSDLTPVALDSSTHETSSPTNNGNLDQEGHLP